MVEASYASGILCQALVSVMLLVGPPMLHPEVMPNEQLAPPTPEAVDEDFDPPENAAEQSEKNPLRNQFNFSERAAPGRPRIYSIEHKDDGKWAQIAGYVVLIAIKQVVGCQDLWPHMVRKIKLSHLRDALAISALFVLCIVSGFYGLRSVHVPMVVVGKNLTPFCMALLELMLLKALLKPRTLPSLALLGSLLYLTDDASDEESEATDSVDESATEESEDSNEESAAEESDAEDSESLLQMDSEDEADDSTLEDGADDSSMEDGADIEDGADDGSFDAEDAIEDDADEASDDGEHESDDGFAEDEEERLGDAEEVGHEDADETAPEDADADGESDEDVKAETIGVGPPTPEETATEASPVAMQAQDDATEGDEDAEDAGTEDEELAQLQELLAKKRELLAKKRDLHQALETTEARRMAARYTARVAEGLAELEAEQSKDLQLSARNLELQREIVSFAGAGAELGPRRLSLETKKQEKAALQQGCREAEASIAARMPLLAENVVQNRQLHNTFLNLKGNVRVCCRMRPQLPSEEGEPLKVELQDDGKISVHSPFRKSNTGGRDVSTSWDFHFDQVFSQEATQAGIFEEIELLVQSALDGYRVGVFAYGQTSSGKTYTMEGPKEDQHSAEGKGIIPRAVDFIYSEIKSLEQKEWSFKVTMSMIEIYNDAVVDLLAGAEGADPSKRTARVPVESAAAVHHFLKEAEGRRHVADTACNARSSRSHVLFELRLTGSGPGRRNVSGLLSLVDLAGSERVKRSKASGERLNEARHINRSLSALGDVVAALARRSKTVPSYRNSALTMNLKELFREDSKTLMFVNVSMCNNHLNESLSSLRFASKVHTVNVGVAARAGGA